MEILFFANLFVFVIVFIVGTFKGLNLKKWSSWLYGLYGFLSGFFVSSFREDASRGLKLTIDWAGGIQIGAIFAFIVMYTGAMNLWHRQLYNKDTVQAWLSQHGQKKEYSLLARIIKLLISK